MSTADFTLGALVVLASLSALSAWLVRRADLRKQNAGGAGPKA